MSSRTLARLCGVLAACLLMATVAVKVADAVPPLGAASATPAGSSAISIVDMAGRTVTLTRPATRIVLTESPDYIALSLIDREPAARVVGWNKFRLDPATLDALRAGDPRFDRIALMSIDGPDALPIERIIALQPDLVVVAPLYLRNVAALDRLAAAGIPAAVLRLVPEMRAQDPLSGLKRFGRLIGRGAEAERYAAFFDERLARVRQRVADVPKRPTVLLEPHAGSGPCCLSVGRGENIGDMVEIAGGAAIGADVITGMVGRLSLEYVLSRDPDVYVGVGGAHLAGRGGLVLGVGYRRSVVEASLAGVVDRTGFSGLSAVRQRRVHGFWFPLASGVNIVVVEALAKWFYPDRFTDVDPDETMAEINRRFLATPLHGVFTTSLPAGRR